MNKSVDWGKITQNFLQEFSRRASARELLILPWAQELPLHLCSLAFDKGEKIKRSFEPFFIAPTDRLVALKMMRNSSHWPCRKSLLS